MNITKTTFAFTLIQAILGVTASSMQDHYPSASFWCGYGVAISGAVLLTIKQFFPASQPPAQTVIKRAP